MRPLLHVNAIKRRDRKHSPPTTIARSPGGEAGKVGRESSNFLLLSALHALRSTLDSWAADMSATLSKGNRRSSARWLYTTFLAVVYVVVVASAVSGAALSSCFTFDVQKCRLSWPKLREIYANAKVNKRSLHKLSERQRHINWVWVTDWLSDNRQSEADSSDMEEAACSWDPCQADRDHCFCCCPARMHLPFAFPCACPHAHTHTLTL